MTTTIPFDAASRKLAAKVAPCLVTMCLASAAFAEPTTLDEAEPRQSTSRQYAEGGRAKSSAPVTTDDRFVPLLTAGKRAQPGKLQTGSKPSASVSQAPRNDFWVYYADVELFYDDDLDGYFYGIDVLFDVDTLYEVADVYAVLYLSFEGGPWNEYAATDDFSIFGATSEDEYVVVTELDSGYPTGSYDLLIEIYDAFDGAFLTSLGPADTSELSLLPLEDFNRDDPHFDDHHHHPGGGGALDLWTFGLMSISAGAVGLIRRRKRQRRVCS